MGIVYNHLKFGLNFFENLQISESHREIPHFSLPIYRFSVSRDTVDLIGEFLLLAVF